MSDPTLHPAHPEVELLAEHAEQLLSPEQSAELTAHLASCAECRETYAALVELSALLGDEPSPGPMPADVAARIDTALAAERDSGPADEHALLRAQAADTATTTGERGRTDGGGRTDDETYESGTDRHRSDSTSGSGSGTGSGTKRRPAGERPGDKRPRRSPRSARARRVLATLALFVAAGGIGIAVSRGGDLDSGGTTSASAAGAASATARSPRALAVPAYNFTQSNLASEVQRLASDSAHPHVAGHTVGTVPSPSTSPTAPPSASQSPAGGALVTPNGGPESPGSTPAQPTAPACVLAATRQTQPPAVEGLGSYLDVEVFALLYPDRADPAHTWDVYLVQNSCSAPLVMLHASVPRG